MGYPMTLERVLARNSGVLEPLPMLRDDIRRLSEDGRREALREAREAVAALPLYDGTAVTRADSAENVRDRAVAAIDALMEGSPK